MTCEDCNRSRCEDCGEHYCCEACPCGLSHNCDCGCREFERRVMADWPRRGAERALGVPSAPRRPLASTEPLPTPQMAAQDFHHYHPHRPEGHDMTEHTSTPTNQQLDDQRIDEIAERLSEARLVAEKADWMLQDYQVVRQQQADAAALVAEIRRQRALYALLADRWDQIAAMHCAGHPEAAHASLSGFEREEAGKGHGYRKAVADLREALTTGRIPHDLMTEADETAAAAPAVVGGVPGAGQ